MEFLIDEDMPRSTSDLLRRYGHKSVDVRDVALGVPRTSRLHLMLRAKACVL